MLVVTADVRLEAVNVGQRDDEEGETFGSRRRQHAYSSAGLDTRA